MSDNNFEKSEYSEFKKKCNRLEEENSYLRKLLNIAPDQVITIPNKICDLTEAQTIPNQKHSETISSNRKVLEHETNEDFSIHTKDYLVSQPDITLEPVVTLSPQEKIKLYRRLFHGREDVFASRWENKNGRAGYSPACANEWDRKVCRKPQIKCSECSHSKWLPITDQVIHDHLTGKKFLGVYPLNLDENCYFLALDFDKDTWQKDAVAFFKICQNLSIPAVLERSQSGNGAHIWIFFADAISARLARSLGTALLSRTMQECHTLRMESYDRLFPNQDTLPKGGFGNLIALPLQGKRRKEGNSIFLNEKLEPYNNPWELLEKIRPMENCEVMSLLGQLEQQGNIIDVRLSQTDEEKLDPWVSNKSVTKYPVIDDTLPSNIELVLANLIYIPINELSPKLINQLKKIAAFQNPEFYRKQAMRLSTYGKPRIIYCAKEFTEHLGLPRGCEDEILELFQHYGINVNISDEAQIGNSIDIDFVGELREEQKKAFEAILPYRYGILSAATAFGKTVLAARIIAERKTNTLILVHRQQLLDQWRERLSVFLGISTKSIGTISNGRNKLTGNIDIAMLQSLSKKGDVIEEVTQYGQVIVDECHHLAAFTFEDILKKVRARYVLGLTATPIRKDGHHPIIIMQCGPIRYRSNNKHRLDPTKHQACIRRTKFSFQNMDTSLKMSEVYAALTINEERNEQIFNDVLLALKDKRKPLLLTERTQHLHWFTDKLSKFVKHIFVLQGGMKQKERQNILKTLTELPHDTERLIIATGQYIGEGFDDSQLDTLFLTLPISWHGKLQQYVGRLHRFHQNKNDILVYDYLDSDVPILNKMYQKRLKKYKAMGYSINEK